MCFSWNTEAVDNQKNLLIFVNGKFVCYKEIVTHLAQSLENLWVLRLINCQQQGLNLR